MKKVITTVGTSIFTNYKSEEVRDYFGDEYKSIEDDYKDLLDKGLFDTDDLETTLRNKWLKGIKKTDDGDWEEASECKNFDASAEIKSLKEIQSDCKEKIKVILIASDTESSKLAAELIKEFFKDDESVVIEDIKIIKKLNVTSADDFENEGLLNLTNIIYELIKDKDNENKNDEEENNDSIMNITGGYKGVIPYLTVLSQVYNIPIKYIFEDSESLIEVPQLPINFDWYFAEYVYPFIINTSKGKVLSELSEDDKEFLVLNKIINRKNKLTIIGQMIEQFVLNNLTSSKSVLGSFVEYKLYHYFSELFKSRRYIDKFKNEYNFVEMSNKTYSKRELDLVFSNSDNKDLIITEIKSTSQILNYDRIKEGKKESVLDQMISQIKNLKKDYSCKEYHICTYMFDYSLKVMKKILKRKLVEIDKKIKQQFSALEIKFWLYSLDTTGSREEKGKIYTFQNGFQNFITKDLDRTNFHIYKLNEEGELKTAENFVDENFKEINLEEK